jgi:hypothetical protein
MHFETNHFAAAMLMTSLAVAGAGCGDNLTVPPARDPAESDPLATLECVPNLDGEIQPGELATAIGVPIRYLVSPPGVERAVDVVGFAPEGSPLTWDFSIDYADDQEQTVVPHTTEGKWYADLFPPDAFVTPLDAGGRVEQIARLDDTALYLLGVVSTEADPPEGQTRLIYTEPVAILRFPIAPGVSFSSSGDVDNGTLLGLPYAGRDTYEVAVDATGIVELPSLRFTQAHRVRTQVTVEPAVGSATTQRQVSFFFECFAEVVRVTSRTGEPEANFTVATDVRRLGF